VGETEILEVPKTAVVVYDVGRIAPADLHVLERTT